MLRIITFVCNKITPYSLISARNDRDLKKSAKD